MTNSPFTRPTRTAPTVAPNGMSERANAAAAPLMATTSGSFSLSAEKTSAMICVSLRKPSGEERRMGRSIWRAVRISFSLGRPSRLINPPGCGHLHRCTRDNPLSAGKSRCLPWDRVKATAVASTTVSPAVTRAAPEACFAMAPGLKDQTLAAGKLDGYFMLRRHRVLFSFFARETCGLEAPEGRGTERKARQGSRRTAGRAQRVGVCAGERILPACVPAYDQGLY